MLGRLISAHRQLYTYLCTYTKVYRPTGGVRASREVGKLTDKSLDLELELPLPRQSRVS